MLSIFIGTEGNVKCSDNSEYLLNSYCVLGSFPSVFHGITALILPTTLWGWYYCYSHYTAMATKARISDAIAKVRSLGQETGPVPKNLTTAHTVSHSYKQSMKCRLSWGISSRIVIRGQRKRSWLSCPDLCPRDGKMEHNFYIMKVLYSIGRAYFWI